MTLLEAIDAAGSGRARGDARRGRRLPQPGPDLPRPRPDPPLLVAIGGIIEDVQVTRELDGVTFFTATVEEHPVDGVLVERDRTEGRIAEITLMLRPLAQLQAAVARMARALAELALVLNTGRDCPPGSPGNAEGRATRVSRGQCSLHAFSSSSWSRSSSSTRRRRSPRSQKQPTAVGSGGAAATVDLDGTRAAIQALRDGGNAVDAAVAAAGVLGVTEPYSCGIGGGGFMVIRTAGGKVTTIDGREESPATMRPDSFWENGAPLPFDDARFSGISAGIPGTLATWQLALRRYGTWSLGRALQPGIRVARDGFKVDSTFVSQTEPNVDWFNDIPSTAAIYLDPDGTPRDEGSTLQNPDLARTYRRIADNGADWFYDGPVAGAMARRRAASAQGRERQPRLAARPHDARRRGPLQGDRARADPHRLPRPRRLGHGPAVERRLDRRRGAQHPRGLQEASRPTACGRSTSCSRRRASPSPTATPTWPTPTSSTSRSPASCPTASPPSGGR